MSRYIHRGNITITDQTEYDMSLSFDSKIEVITRWVASVDCAMMEQDGVKHKSVENLELTRDGATMEEALAALHRALYIAGVEVRG